MKIIGHQKIINLLDRSLKKGKIAQAYLFCGPESVGKFLLAKILAQTLISGTSTTAILRNMAVNEKVDQMIDLFIAEPKREEKKGIIKEKDIKIEQIREAQKFLLTYPVRGKYKILIINNAQRMTEAAQNSLLKILEEPNSTSIIILVAHEPEKILPTLRSRCQKINFNLVEDEEMKAGGISGEIAKLSMGRPGIAKILAEDRERFKEWQEEAGRLEKIFGFGINERLELAEKLSKNIAQAIKKLELWTWILRSEKGGIGRYKTISLIDRSISELSGTNASSRLILEDLLIKIGDAN